MLAFVSTNVMAGWFPVTDNASYTGYADLSTAHKAGGKAKMWVLYDFKVALNIRGNQIFSMREQRWYNCKKEQSAAIYVTMFNHHMAGGQVVSTGKVPIEWDPVSPGSIGKDMFDVACGNYDN